MQSELHLDEDEWATILLALKVDHEKAIGEHLKSYRQFLESIMLKIEIALQH